jgi:hypothetical protein
MLSFHFFGSLVSSVADPVSLNPDSDPAFQMNPDPGVCCLKNEKKNTAEKLFYLSLGLQERAKENIQRFKK